MNEIVKVLLELKADAVIVASVYENTITELRCCMAECICPDGREFFTKRKNPLRSKWAPSADRYPIPGRDGGEYVVGNVRLAHWGCNQLEGARIGGKMAPAEGRAKGGRAAAKKVAENGYHQSAKGQADHSKYGKLGSKALIDSGYHDTEYAHEAAVSRGKIGGPRSIATGSDVKGRCGRWQIGRGKPCTCGQHDKEVPA